MKKLQPRLLSSSILTVLMLGSSGAWAQSSAPDTPDVGGQSASATEQAKGEDPATLLPSITVTARGVAESLQKVPLPITAISSETIEKKGLADISDIAAITPSFSFQAPFGRNLDRPVIRGMSNILGEPNASFFINGVYVEGNVSAYGLENIERVEVIRGPQSAQFGRRTFSGAVNFITADPGSRPGGKVTLGFGNNGQEKTSLFYSARSESGTFGFDASYYKAGNDGLFHNQASGRKDLGGRESQSAMLAAYWSPTDKLELTARVMNQRNRDQMFPIQRLGANRMNCYLPQYTGASIGGVIPILSSRQTGAFCGQAPAPDSFAINTKEYLAAGYLPGTKYNYLRSSLQAEYFFDNGWNLTSTTAYNENESYLGVDQDYSGARGFGGAFESIGFTTSSDWSQDLVLNSDQSLPVSGSIGTYYYKLEAGRGYRGDLTGFFLPPTRSVQTIPTNPDESTVSKAVYGMLRWSINDKWSTSLETRYARDEIRKAGVDVRVLSGQTYSRPYNLNTSYSNFTPRLSLTHHINDHVNVFGLVSRGTKPGGFNLDVQRADFTEQSREALIAQGLHKFDQEKAWNYELGLKSDLLDGALRLNAGIYQIDWDNQQLTQGSPVDLRNGTMFSTSYISNIGKSRVRGFEFESQWAFAEGWLANLTYSYTNAEVVEYPSQSQADLFCSTPPPNIHLPCANAKGNNLPLVPKNLASLGLLYTGQFGSGWGYDASFSTSYQSSNFGSLNNLAIIPAKTVSNLRFNLRPTENFSVSAYVNNLFDDDTATGVLGYIDPTRSVARPNVPPLTGLQVTNLSDVALSPSLPRMYGVELSYRF
ncbi:MAG: TonB-dependent receptor [Xanthomonadales bacterium]|nr:TonB-dependent receptor [Xanthomonadales bacterium]